jgi:hydroxymethylpyrimidine pyrophosphatase-like HAD family hydrolase/fructoselysine-6-P-deglycase FrlB-like protein
MEVDIAPLRAAIRTASLYPIRATGSGGSLTVAHAIANLHQTDAHRLAAVSTPLELVSESLDSCLSNWIFSAGGTNVDVLAAARALIRREPRQIAVLCGRNASPLADLCRRHPFVDLLIYEPPAGKDGFLATNSLLGFVTLLARAYAEETSSLHWKASVEAVSNLLASADKLKAWKVSTAPLWDRPTTIVLYGPSTRVGAVDLESKFTEAALGSIQLADYRNFAHGRHHWLAKRGDLSGVLAFVSDEESSLARRTLDLIPLKIPRVCIDVPGPNYAALLGSLIAALEITETAGRARGIDPGQPGVPQFGRKLYRLSSPKREQKDDVVRLAERDAIAISRKTGVPIHKLETLGGLARWQNFLNKYRERLYAATFGAVAFDYDGTLVDIRHRFGQAPDGITDELTRLLKSGIMLAVATGRGASARRDLRAKIPEKLWKRMLVGYYNGAEVSGLDGDDIPDGSSGTCDELCVLAAALRSQPELADAAIQTDRKYQITLEAKPGIAESRLWDIAQQVVRATRSGYVGVTRSSHSIDIVAIGTSKLAVLSRLRSHVGEAPILTIGDRGRWPGNDYELLQEKFSLSVDETSVDPESCWNLASAGQRGIAATLEYLHGLKSSSGAARFTEKVLG